MQLRPSDVQRLEQFFNALRGDIYPEPLGEPHIEITRRMVKHAVDKLGKPNGRVLDVGCGTGLALKLFQELGLRPIGINLCKEDIDVCRGAGHDVREMDQSFLDFEDNAFDLLWCRHCIEHSPMPLFTLFGFARVLAKGGLLYIEVPAPDTSCNHQENPNHYSVLGQSMWLALIQRAGFEIVDKLSMKFEVPVGPDEYWGIVARKI